ncbi:hypothetical protein EYF80_041451 [Liparis tanakae]|uniref:Uncharacterized protein n=1 Tax=Liparis tanakae TaxID=230148 RepID=A0A4Z2G636_9TELE|nr:hypothetical protein EYF80_041451 [Liparis tanakae]
MESDLFQWRWLEKPINSGHCDPPPPQAPPIGITATLLLHHHQCLDSMGGFCLRRYQHLYPWTTPKKSKMDEEFLTDDQFWYSLKLDVAMKRSSKPDFLGLTNGPHLHVDLEPDDHGAFLQTGRRPQSGEESTYGPEVLIHGGSLGTPVGETALSKES